MLHQPTYLHPYLESVDVTNPSGIDFSAIINPKDAIKWYQFRLLDKDSNSIYSEGWKAVKNLCGTEFLYGTEEGTIWRRHFDYDEVSSLNLVNGEMYKWQIAFGNGDGNEDVTTPYYHFTTKSTPTITLNLESGEIINSSSYKFVAAYSQQQKERYMYYKYSLYKEGVLIDETSEKIDSMLSYTYNSFVPGSYLLLLEIADLDGQIHECKKSFAIEYNIQPVALSPVATSVNDQNCIDIDFSQSVFVKGNTNSNITYSTINDNSDKNILCATIPEGGTIYYNKIHEAIPLEIDENDFTIYYRVRFSELFVGNIITLTNEENGDIYNVRFDGENFWYKIGIAPEIKISVYNKTLSVMQSVGTDLDCDALYVLDDNDTIDDEDIFLYNDVTYNHWWIFVLLPDEVKVYKNECIEHKESVVNS